MSLFNTDFCPVSSFDMHFNNSSSEFFSQVLVNISKGKFLKFVESNLIVNSLKYSSFSKINSFLYKNKNQPKKLFPW